MGPVIAAFGSTATRRIQPKRVREQPRDAQKRSSFASEVLRSETRTLIRSGEPSTAGSASANDPGRRRRRGRGSTPSGRGRGRRHGRPVRPRARRTPIRRRLDRRLGDRLAEAPAGRRSAGEHHDERFLRQLAQRPCDRRAQEGGFAPRWARTARSAASAIRWADDTRFLARGRRRAARRARSRRTRSGPEGRGGCGAHAAFSILRASSSTYTAGSTSSGVTSYRRQNA